MAVPSVDQLPNIKTYGWTVIKIIFIFIFDTTFGLANGFAFLLDFAVALQVPT
jgi:hypothetical protein